MRAVTFVVATALGLATPAFAAQNSSSDAAIDAALSCRSIADPSARLACLDKAAAAIAETRIIRDDKAPAPEAATDMRGFGAPNTPASAPTTSTTPQEFGSEQVKEVRRARAKEHSETRLEAKVVEARFNPYKVATITLDNGQVWQQLESDDVNLNMFDGKLYTVRIKRGFMGNYMMTVNELKRTIRVRRVK